MKWKLNLIWTVACIVIFSRFALAHDMKISGIKVRLEKSNVTVSIAAHGHTLDVNASSATLSHELARRLKLRLDGQRFVAKNPQILRDSANGIVIWQAQSQKPATRVEVDAPLFPERKNEATVLTVFHNRQVLGEALLNAQNPSAHIGVAHKEAPLAVIWRFLREGMAHIFAGLDHVLFLVSLLLLGGTWRQLFKIVTSFTLAHSLTLSLAATGVFTPPSRFIEPLIALSIVIVAVCNLREEQTKSRLDFRLALAFAFGLIHGFGFASALTETGLPHEALGWALFAFNAGVELGQAALVLFLAPLLAYVVKNCPRLREPLVFYGSATVAVVGAFWFAQRIFTV